MGTNPRTPMVTVCAPAWKNTLNELKDYTVSEKYMTGMCLKLREDLTTIPCDSLDGSAKNFHYCWPFWPSGGSQEQFTYSQSGMAVDFSKDGYEVITGPGFNDWNGAYRDFNTIVKTNEGGNTQYFGYALSVGKFRDADTVVGIPNWHTHIYGYYGKVMMYKNNTIKATIQFGLSLSGTTDECPTVVVQDLIDKEQTGTKFGATLASIDITGDGFDEIFVGSPLYSGDRPDEGRVFVYTMLQSGRVCGPIGILSGSARYTILKEMSAFARFGSSIASVGDLNKDGYKDVAIGAPYENDGTGAIYIYHGIGNCNCSMEDKFSQRIKGYHNIYKLLVYKYKNEYFVNLGCLNCKGSQVFNGVKSFGWSIYGDEDVDDNSYPAFSWTFKSDTVFMSKEGYSRMKFRGYGTDVIKENITLSRKESDIVEKNYIIDIKGHNNRPEPRNAWTIVRMEGKFELVPSTESQFEVLDPILPEHASIEVSKTVEFDKQCNEIDICRSDLSINVEMFLLRHGRNSPIKVNDSTVIYVDEAYELEVSVIVENLVNSSYRSNFSGIVSALIRRDVRPNEGIVDASCKLESPINKAETTMSCNADSKLDKHENFKVKFYFDISRVRLIPQLNIDNMLESIQIYYKAEQINFDTNVDNNVFKRNISVAFKYDVAIEEDKVISAQESYAADEKSTRKIRLTHTYYIINKGPSYLPLTFVNISIPIKLGVSTVATVLQNKLPKSCRLREQEAIIGTTPTTTSMPTTSDFTIVDPDAEKRRRRSIEEDEPKAAASTSSSETKRHITCSEGSSDCSVIECKISNLEKDNQEIVEVYIDLYEKEIAKQKGAREIGYVTRAVVTDPHILYGGKVVPWKDTVYAEKSTILIVETDTVVEEINIWIIIGAILGALALLVITIVILYKVGFFKRKQHNQVQKWKKESLYNRKSMRMSRTVNPPYNAVDGSDN
ncbi:FG-GAP repeat [Mactra antiquata]